MTDHELQFTRRQEGDQYHYFMANWTEDSVDSWVKLGVEAASAYLFDPVSGWKGVAQTRTAADGALEVRLQMGPNQSLILQSFAGNVAGQPFPYLSESGNAETLAGPWTIRFVSGGPELPATAELESLASWTTLAGENYQKFSGTAVYQTTFSRPAGDATAWLLDLGEVAVSAQVSLNGEDIGTRIGPDFRILIPADKLRDQNTLEVAVSNLMANRIADMDRNDVFYKKFYNVNFPARLAENRDDNGLFTAAGWEPLPSGLLGPVTVTPVMVAE